MYKWPKRYYCATASLGAPAAAAGVAAVSLAAEAGTLLLA
jgi:hypothetical protein